jgi:hypothetical protein
VAEKTLTSTEIEVWLRSVQQELRELDDQLKPLLEEQKRLQARELLLKNLLDSFGDRREPEDSVRVSSVVPATRSDGSIRQYVIDKAVEVLRDEGKPLHINDLHAAFLRRGYSVPGAGKPVNLIVHLRRADEIFSPKRGIYGVNEQAGDVPRTTKPTQTTTRSRAKRRKRKG